MDLKKEKSPHEPTAKKLKDEHLIYVGPTMKNGLTRYAIYRGGIPEHIKAELERIPELRSLFLPVSDFPARQGEIRQAGTSLNAAYMAVQKGV